MKQQTATFESVTWALDFETSGRKIHLEFPSMEGMLKKSAELKREKITPKKTKKVVETTKKTTTYKL